MSDLPLFLTNRGPIIQAPVTKGLDNLGIPLFIQMQVITSPNDKETETRLNLWLAKCEYKEITTIQFTALPAGGEFKMFTAVVFYYPNEQDAKIRYEQAKQMPTDAAITTTKDVNI